MQMEQWLSLYILLITLYGLYKLVPLVIRYKALEQIFYTLSILSISVHSVLTIAQLKGGEWTGLIAILCVLSGLLESIRLSKPVYFRYPKYFSFLPLISLLFYPIVLDSLVISKLINATYQGGAVLVAALIILLHHFRIKKTYFQLIGVTLFLVSYLLYWFMVDYNTPTILIFGIGIVLISKGYEEALETSLNNNHAKINR